MSFGIFRTQLNTLFTNNKGALNVQEVKSGPEMNFTGYPAINITPADNEAVYETTSENARVYGFNVGVFYDTKNTGLNEAIDRVEEVVDAVINLLDEEDLNSSNTIGQSGLPSTYTYLMMSANPSAWGKTEDEALVFAMIEVRILVSIDIS